MKGNGGGLINQLVYDVMVGILILFFLCILVIPAFRDNADLVSAAAQRVDGIEKVKADSMLDIERGEVLGSDVISAIRYYSNSQDVKVVVKNQDGMLIYSSDSNNDIPDISYEDKFDTQHVYDGNSLKEAVFIQK